MEKSIDKFNPLLELFYYRYPRFEALQAVQATPIYFLCKTLIFPLAPSTTVLASLTNFLMFLFALLLFNVTLLDVCCPPPVHRLSPLELLIGVLKRIIFNYNGGRRYRQRLWATSQLYFFIVYSGISVTMAVTSLTASSMVSSFGDYGDLGLRGFVAGMIFAFHRRRWVLEFPVRERPPFFRYKLGVGKAVIEAIKLSIAAYLLTSVLFTNYYYKGQMTRWDLIKGEIEFYFACLVVFLCWELNRNLLQVIFTERLVFAPPKGSIAAESNPSETILTVLEKPIKRRLERYRAYYDLCKVSESNIEVDTWRRDAFFEETGETYKRVITVCLKPLELLTRDLSSDVCVSNELNDPFYYYQIFEWCACTASSLTVSSRKEDRFGVARRSGSYGTAMCTLLSCLLALETITRNNKHSPHYLKAYSMADILRFSVYQIVSVFQEELIVASRYGRLQEDWIASDRPLLYGTHELLVHKLQMFL